MSLKLSLSRISHPAASRLLSGEELERTKAVVYSPACASQARCQQVTCMCGGAVLMSARAGTGMGSRQARLHSFVDADTSDADTLRICPCMHVQKPISRRDTACFACHVHRQKSHHP